VLHFRACGSIGEGHFCPARFSPAWRPFGFVAMRAGLRDIHSLETQYSKKGLSIAMRRAPVWGLMAHGVREAVFCHSAATALASSQLEVPVFLLLNFPSMVPDAAMWQRSVSSLSCVPQIPRSGAPPRAALRTRGDKRLACPII
jgi:hypothetical protein